MPCRITVPDPCHEDWNTMTPVEKGRHCEACRKTVIDFSGWSLEAIATYLRNHSSTSICGRFRNQQLNVEIPYSTEQWVAQVCSTGLSLVQQVALLFLLAFGLLSSSCLSSNNTGPVPATYQTTGLLLLSQDDSDIQAEYKPEIGSADMALSDHDTVSRPKRMSKQKAARLKNKFRKLPEPMPIQGEVQVTAGAPILEEQPLVDSILIKGQ